MNNMINLNLNTLLKKCFLILFLIGEGSCVIYHLNETEYIRMPPLFGLDEHKACISREQGLYCVVRIDLFAEPGNDLMNLIQNYSAMTILHYNHTYLERGICVRETCGKYFQDDISPSTDLAEVLRVCLNDSIYDQYGLQIKKPVVYYCDAHGETENLNWSDWLVAGVCIILLMANLISSLYDYNCNGTSDEDGKIKGNKYLLSFSVKRNWNWLVNVECNNPQTKRLSGIHGIRTLATFCVMFAHAFITVTTGFTDRTHDMEEVFDGHFMRVVFGGLAIVQIFFCMSGFLLAYNLLLQNEKEKFTWKKIPVVMMLRWWRLTPVYAVIIALSATWLRFFGEGPLWKMWVTNSIVADCRKYWWTHMLYINNYFFDNKFCQVPTWHVATDTQIFFVGLLAFGFTVSKTRIPVLCVLTVISIILPGLHVYFENLDAMAFLTPEFYRTLVSDTFRHIHFLGHNNLTSFFIGMISAHFTYVWQNKGIDFHNNKIYSRLLWFVVPVGMVWMYLGTVMFKDTLDPSLWVRIVYQATHRGVMGLFAAFAIIGIVMRCKTLTQTTSRPAPNLLRDILEWRGWVVPSRLSYSLYLWHFSLIHIILGIRTQLGPPFSLYFVWLMQMGMVFISYIVALPLFLFIEAPFNRLMKIVMSGDKKS